MSTVFVGSSLPRSRSEGTRGGGNTIPLKTTAREATANEDRRHLDGAADGQIVIRLILSEYQISLM